MKNERGLIHIYCGDGKGKTTAALGLAVRAACAGKKVFILQFLKSANTAEMCINERFVNIKIATVQKNVKFVFCMNEEERDENRAENRAAFNAAVMNASDFDMLIFDEIIGCIAIGQLEEAALMDFLKNKPGSLEVVLTGRDPSPALTEIADYVSEIKKIKHPFDEGVAARKGIEY